MAPAEAAAIELRLDSVSVVGSTVYDAATLATFYSDLVGTTVSLAEVFAIAAAITARYGQDGYLLSRAIVPPQELEPSGATITIQVVEGYVDQVRWPDELQRYRNYFDTYAARIIAERPLNAKTLERYLLLADDLPGLAIQSSLVASALHPGASTLVITVEEDGKDFFAGVDNYGVTASGPYQGMVGGALNNPLGLHQRFEAAFTIAGLSEDDKLELSYLSFGYTKVVNAEGLEVFVVGNYSRGLPGTVSLLTVEHETESLNVSAGLSFPIIRSRTEDLTGTIAFDYKDSTANEVGVLVTEDRLRIIRAAFDYEKADEADGVNQLKLELSHGIEGLGSTANGNPIASRDPGVVDFFKVTGEIARTQQLPSRFSLYAAGFGQWTGDPLLSSQECGVGGRIYGRGFESSIITGDQCLKGTLELRRNLQLSEGFAIWLNYVQTYAFADYGHIWNINAPVGTPENDGGASAGVGVRFGHDNFAADLAVSTVVKAPDSQGDVPQTRVWFRAGVTY